jgi:hypothetical protein
MATGWTYEQARSLPYPVYLKLKRYWTEVAPPVCVSMAAFVGFKPKPSEEATRPATSEEIFGALGLNPAMPVQQVKVQTKTIRF